MKRAHLVVLAGLVLAAGAAAWWLLRDAAPDASRAGGDVVRRPVSVSSAPASETREAALLPALPGAGPEVVQALLPDPLSGVAGAGRVLGPSRRVSVVVRGEDGEPVAGAVVAAEDDSGARSDPTDADGRTVLRLREDTPTLKGWAFRRNSASVRVPGPDVPLDDEHPLEVVLRRRNALEVRVTGPGGAPVGPLQLGLTSKQPIFASVDRNGVQAGSLRVAPDPVVYAAGMSPLEKNARRNSFLERPTLAFRIDDNGRAELFDLIPGLPFEVSVLDRGSPAWGPQELTLDPGEWRVLTVPLERDPQDLVVRAVDAQGKPLAGARVLVVIPGSKAIAELRVGANGVARFEHLYMTEVFVVVTRDEYLDAEPVQVTLRPGMAPVDVVLTEGLRVHVTLRDAWGALAPVPRLSVSMDGRQVGVIEPDGPSDPATNTVSIVPKSDDPELQAVLDKARKQDTLPGHELFANWTVTTLPPGEMLISLEVNSQSIGLRHDSRDPEAVFVVPGSGALRVQFAQGVKAASTVVLVVRRRDDAAALLGESAITRRIRLDGPVPRFHEWVVPDVLAGDYDVWLTTWEGKRAVNCSAVATTRVNDGVTTLVSLVAP